MISHGTSDGENGTTKGQPNSMNDYVLFSLYYHNAFAYGQDRTELKSAPGVRRILQQEWC